MESHEADGSTLKSRNPPISGPLEFLELHKWKQELMAITKTYHEQILRQSLQQQEILLRAIEHYPMPAIDNAGDLNWAQNNYQVDKKRGDTTDVLNRQSGGAAENNVLDTSQSRPSPKQDRGAAENHVLDATQQSGPSPKQGTLPQRTSSMLKSLTKPMAGDDTLHHHHKSFVESQAPLSDRQNSFDLVVGTMIVLNAIQLLVQSEWAGWRLSVELQLQEDDGSWDNTDKWFYILEHAFTAFFLVELIGQLAVHKIEFFKEWFNWIDTVVVVTNCVDLYILEPLQLFTFGPVTLLRLLRILKLVKTLRIIRAAKLFKGLRVLIKAIASSMMSLVWSMLLLFIFATMAGLLMNKTLEDFIKNPDNTYEWRLWCWKHYGTALRAIYTMIEVTLSGCWPNYVRPLLDHVSHYFGLIFLFYVTVVVFAVIRIITAMFLKDTLDAASLDAATTIAEKAKKRQILLRKLQGVFKHSDENKDGTMSYEEFDRVMNDPDVKLYLAALELEVHESEMLFTMIDDGDGSITYEEFINGVSRLKGQARTLDLVALQLDMKKVLEILSPNSSESFMQSGKRAPAALAQRCATPPSPNVNAVKCADVMPL